MEVTRLGSSAFTCCRGSGGITADIIRESFHVRLNPNPISTPWKNFRVTYDVARLQAVRESSRETCKAQARLVQAGRRLVEEPQVNIGHGDDDGSHDGRGKGKEELEEQISSSRRKNFRPSRENRKKPPSDLLHSLAKRVAERIVLENLEVQEIMKVVAETGLRVEVRSMNMVIWELGQLQGVDAAAKAFRAFRDAGVDPNSHVYTTLIAIYG